MARGWKQLDIVSYVIFIIYKGGGIEKKNQAVEHPQPLILSHKNSQRLLLKSHYWREGHM